MRNILSQNAFWIVNKEMAKKVGLDAALLLSDLVTKQEYFIEEWFFNTADNIKEDTTLSYYQQKKEIKILVDKGFIETKLVGVPPRLNFKILENQILSFLNIDIRKTEDIYNKNTINKNTFNNILVSFNSLCIKLPQIKQLTNKRNATIRGRIKDFSEKEIIEVFRIVSKNKFLNGDNDRNWKADFDWIMNPNNFIKILEGKYTSNETTTKDYIQPYKHLK